MMGKCTTPRVPDEHLLLLLLLAFLLLGGGGSALSLDSARAASTKGRSEGKVDVLLRVKADNERRNVDDLLANTRTKVNPPKTKRDHGSLTGCDAA